MRTAADCGHSSSRSHGLQFDIDIFPAKDAGTVALPFATAFFTSATSMRQRWSSYRPVRQIRPERIAADPLCRSTFHAWSFRDLNCVMSWQKILIASRDRQARAGELVQRDTDAVAMQLA